MRVTTTILDGVTVIEPEVFEDERGFFFETYHQAKFAEFGLRASFVQDNHSRSVRGTLRGLHFQMNFPQAKLCRVIDGVVLDVVVDIRRGSPTFGKWIGVELSAENKRAIYIPRGFAHGFLVRSASADFLYKCDNFYHAEDERGIIWNDPTLAIAWGAESPMVSAKDQKLPTLSSLLPNELPKY
jgi:dTDP-4-dehydrorhamnose 3,5-epimerase